MDQVYRTSFSANKEEFRWPKQRLAHLHKPNYLMLLYGDIFPVAEIEPSRKVQPSNMDEVD